MNEASALRFESLVVDYKNRRLFSWGRGDAVRAVDKVSMTLERGKIMGIIGQSGSGKSSLLKALCKFIPIQEGRIFIEEIDVTKLSSKEFFPYRKKIQMIPQDFCDIFNPKMTVEKILAEPLKVHFPDLSSQERAMRILELLKSVELDHTLIERLPSQLSGGQRQRISIARALAVNPKILICDEIVSACDLYTQKQILLLLQKLNRTKNLTMLFVSHNIAVVAYLCHDIAVMRQGRILEVGPPERLCWGFSNGYTQSLVDAIPPLKRAKK
ncbi:MAG: dipeptide/oligopeptide/nickel ABC transporter ATP-binding protein [Puniceicoccales bacterium]|jgi:peptide/nickel transport system ATP-binding protein/oligopeptide transport system ATP-binding protein|nr:dipeptide/oligopeptide/nickel ABC transporter ATP-binding protein [Puniceicoccales bacterium]